MEGCGIIKRGCRTVKRRLSSASCVDELDDAAAANSRVKGNRNLGADLTRGCRCCLDYTVRSGRI